MKKSFLFIFIGVGFCLSAQQPTIHSHTILPVNPTISSQIKIVTHLETPYSGFLVDKTHTVSPTDKTIKLNLCYANGMATVISHHIDTFAIGIMPQGVYSIQLAAYISSAGQWCNRVDSNFATTTLTVGGPVGFKENSQKRIRIFPNPAYDRIIIEPAENKPVRILTLQGQLVRVAEVSSPGSFSLQGLSGGMYLLEVDTSEGKEVHRIVIQ